jgi:uncharacterized membrane protein (UPF0127 family)
MSQTKSITPNDDYRIDLELKSSFFQKFRGLLGVKHLGEKQGIVLVGCKQVHTFWMQFPIDIVVLDKDFKIIDFVGDLKANKISPYYRRGYYIIELATNPINEKLFKEGKKVVLN